jgi:hypothetical protein
VRYDTLDVANYSYFEFPILNFLLYIYVCMYVDSFIES